MCFIFLPNTMDTCDDIMSLCKLEHKSPRIRRSFYINNHKPFLNLSEPTTSLCAEIPCSSPILAQFVQVGI